MTAEKVKEVTAFYRTALSSVNPQEVDKSTVWVRNTDSLCHARWMIDQIDIFCDADRLEKAFRWLGFVQGVLWTRGIFTIEDMANHNRPDPVKE